MSKHQQKKKDMFDEKLQNNEGISDEKMKDMARELLEEVAPNTPAEEDKPNYYEQFVRLSADFENFRKRTEREKAAFISYGKKALAEKLLPSYEILLKQSNELNKKDTLKNVPNELKSVVSGMGMLLTEMEKAFRSEGIEKMDVLNKPYDPATQEVVAMIPAEEKQDGLVLQEVQMGFMLDGKVLRPARVIVGQHTEA